MRWRDVALTLVFPVAYGLMVLVTHNALGVPVPYSFLDPAQSSWGVVIATCTLTVMVFLVTASAERFVLAFRKLVEDRRLPEA